MARKTGRGVRGAYRPRVQNRLAYRVARVRRLIDIREDESMDEANRLDELSGVLRR